MVILHEHTRLLEFGRKEAAAIFTVAFLFAFALTFRMWGADEFDPAVGLFNLVVVLLGMLVVVFLHEGGHKVQGALEGYSVRIRMFGAGKVFSLIAIVYSQGYIPLVTPNVLALDARPDLRLRSFRPHENPSNMARIAMAGLVGTTLAIVLFKTLYMLTGFGLFMTIVFGAALHGVFSLIPFELAGLAKLRYFQKVESQFPGDGMHILWWSVPGWIFALLFMLVFSAIAMITTTTSYFISAVIAAVGTYAILKWR